MCLLTRADPFVARNLNEWQAGEGAGTQLSGHLIRREVRASAHAVDFTSSNRETACPFGGVLTTRLPHDDLAE